MKDTKDLKQLSKIFDKYSITVSIDELPEAGIPYAIKFHQEKSAGISNTAVEFGINRNGGLFH